MKQSSSSDFFPEAKAIFCTLYFGGGMQWTTFYSRLGTIPTGAIVLGVNMPDHQLAMTTLKEMILV